MEHYWGIDLGGTKIEGVIVKGCGEPNVICRVRIATEAEKGYDHVLQRIESLVQSMMEKSGLKPTKIGIGTPGTLDPSTGLLQNCNSTCLNGRSFQHDLEEELGIPVIISNDANCFALAETKFGAVRRINPDAQVVFGVIMGSGVGAGVVVDGQVIRGRQGIAGEWGHNFLDESGGACYCGRVGCVETILSGKSLERFYFEKYGEKKNLQHIYIEYLSGQSREATEVINRLTSFFGKAMAQVINILDPDVIVLGGGVGNIDHLYSLGVEEVEKYVFNTKPNIAILKPELGDSAGVFGAALLTVE